MTFTQHLLGWLVFLSASLPLAVAAQIVPDQTLGNESSRVRRAAVRGREADLIEGGATRGRNLFHSFREFGVREGDAAYFANPVNIENIFGRVTGNNPSNILGILGVDGAANLLLMNPNGILFGPNASLDIQGSFLGTTANAIQFGDLGFFNTDDGTTPGLLTVNPSAFFFNQITNQGGTIANAGTLATGQDLTLSGHRLDLQGRLTAGRNLTLEASDTLRIRDSATSPFVAAAVGQMRLQGNRVVDIFALNHPNSGLVSGGDMVLRSANQVGGDAHFWSGGNFRIERLNGSLGNLFSPHDPFIISSGDISFENYTGRSLHILAGGSVIIPGQILINGADGNGTALTEVVTLSDNTSVEIDGNTQPTLDIRAGIDWLTALGQFPPNFGNGIQVPPAFFGTSATSADITVGNIVMDAPDGIILLTNEYVPNRSLPGGTIIVAGAGANPGQLIQNGIDARGFGGNGSSVILDARGSIVVADSAVIDTSAILTNTGRGGDIRLIAGDAIQLEQDSLVSTSFINPIQFFTSPPTNDIRGGNIRFDAPNITLARRAVMNASRGGNIEIQSNRLTLQEASINSFVAGSETGGNIQINTTETIQNNGSNIGTFVGPFASGRGGNITITTGELVTRATSLEAGTGGDIGTDTVGQGDAGDITINAEKIRVLDGSQIRANTGIEELTSGQGNAGDLSITVSELLEVSGSLPSNQQSLSRISADTFSAGAAGEVTIKVENGDVIIRDGGVIGSQVQLSGTGAGGDVLLSANNVLLQNGGQISAGTFGAGEGGTLTINASGNIEVNGVRNGSPSGIFTATYGFADANDLIINARRMSILNGGQVSSSTVGIGEGKAGNLNVTATDSLEVAGASADGDFTSLLTSGSGLLTNLSFGGAIGDSGSLTINTGELNVRDSGEISTQAFGTGEREGFLGRAGNAGAILINARNVTVNNGVIAASTNGPGQAGSVTVNATDEIQLLGGDLRTRTIGAGNAGDLIITAGQLTMRNGEATAATNNGGGRGGNISVTVRGTTELIGGQAGFAASSFRSGNAGNLTLQTNQLIVRDGASVITESIGRGRAGDLTIIAPGGIEISGGQFRTGAEANASINNNLPGAAPFDPNQTYFFPSRISANIASILPDTPAANLAIQTGQLTVRNGSEISTQTLGTSRGGRLSVNASRINLIGNSGNLRADVEANPSLLSAQTSNTGNGGDIQLEVGQLQISDGAAISAAAVARIGDPARGRPGSISIRNAESVTLATNGEISTVIEPGVVINRTAPDSGNIEIQTRRLAVNSGAQITASTSGQGNAGDITVRAADTINLNRGNISTAVNVGAIGQGGNISLETSSLSLANRSSVTSSTSGQGNTGSITANANERINLSDNSSITSTVNSGATGNSQQIILKTPNLFLNNAQISASTAGTGNAGNIAVQRADTISLDNSSISTAVVTQAAQGAGGNIAIQTGQLALNRSRISSSTSGQGNTGSIAITAREATRLRNQSRITSTVNQGATGNSQQISLTTADLSLQEDSVISAATNGNGSAGDIEIQAAEQVSLSNSTISSAVGSNSTGRGGNIRLSTNRLNLDNARISARTQAQGRGGDIALTAQNRINAIDSDIETRSEFSSSGNITVSAGAIRLRGNSDIRTQVNQGTGSGGNITLTADSIVAFDDSDIVTRAPEGQGGDIRFDTPAFFGAGYIADAPEADGNNRVDVDASGVRSGVVTAPDVSFIQNSLADLPAGTINTDQLLANSCIARTDSFGRGSVQGGTFLITGRGGLPAAPGNDAAASYPTGEVRTIPVEETWQPGDPIVEPQGVYRLPDGRLIMSRECSN